MTTTRGVRNVVLGSLSVFLVVMLTVTLFVGSALAQSTTSSTSAGDCASDCNKDKKCTVTTNADGVKYCPQNETCLKHYASCKACSCRENKSGGVLVECYCGK